MTENTKDEVKMLQEPLIAKDVQFVAMDEPTAVVMVSPTTSDALASQHQVRGAAWVGGISGLLVGGPIGALLFGWGAVHLAKKNAGDVGNFCRKSGDFMCRIGNSIQHEWSEARGDNK